MVSEWDGLMEMYAHQVGQDKLYRNHVKKLHSIHIMWKVHRDLQRLSK